MYVHFGELILRFGVAVIFTVASVLLIYVLVTAKRYRPGWPDRPLYVYLFLVVFATTVWRWIVAIFGLWDQRDVQKIDWFVTFINPINQSLIGLLGFALILHGVNNIRKMKERLKVHEELLKVTEQLQKDEK